MPMSTCRTQREPEAASVRRPRRAAVPWRLHGFRLDYGAAVRAVAAGKSAAEVAIAAGSQARSRRNLQRVGLKIIAKLVSSGQVYEASARLGYDIEEFCRDLIAAITQATKVVRIYDRGRVVGVFEDPDWKARTAARWQWMRAVGIDKLPLTAPEGELTTEPGHG